MKKGDTIIEVIFAVSVFAMVAIASLLLMNRGLATTQSSLELTLARNEMESQASALRFIQSSKPTEWTEITKNAAEEIPPSSIDPVKNACSIPTNSFVISPYQLSIGHFNSGKIRTATVYPRVYYNASDAETNTINPTTTSAWYSEGLWIVAVKPRGAGSNPKYYDFHIRACWAESGKPEPSTLGTIVRLYNPGGNI